MEFPLWLSSAASWVRCAFFPAMAGSAYVLQLDAEQDNTVREEGIAAHWAASEIMCGRPVNIGDVAPNNVTLNDELMGGVDTYLEVLDSFGVKQWHIETDLVAPTIGQNARGRPDAFGWDSDGTLVIPDFKMGYRPVDVWPNWTLIGYLAAIIDNYDVREDALVKFAIVQPRVYSRDAMQTHVIRALDTVQYIMALNLAASAVSIGAPATSGPHCADCKGRHVCVTAHRAGAVGLEIAGEATIYELPPLALDTELQRVEGAIAMLTARSEALQAQARQLLRSGGILPHWQITHSAGRKGYIDEKAEQAVIALGDLLGHDLRKPLRAVAVGQASKVIEKSLLDAYITRKRGPDVLAPVTENMIASAFSSIKD